MGLFDNINWNPLDSSLFTGKGLPWGGMQTADPGDMPGVPKERSLDEFSAFDQSEMVKRLISNLRGGSAKQSTNLLRQASRLGGAQSDAARRGLGDIAANVEDRAAGVELQAAKDAWEDKMRQKQYAENMDMQRYQQALAQWGAKKAERGAEEQKRAAGLKSLATFGLSNFL